MLQLFKDANNLHDFLIKFVWVVAYNILQATSWNVCSDACYKAEKCYLRNLSVHYYYFFSCSIALSCIISLMHMSCHITEFFTWLSKNPWYIIYWLLIHATIQKYHVRGWCISRFWQRSIPMSEEQKWSSNANKHGSIIAWNIMSFFISLIRLIWLILNLPYLINFLNLIYLKATCIIFLSINAGTS